MCLQQRVVSFILAAAAAGWLAAAGVCRAAETGAGKVVLVAGAGAPGAEPLGGVLQMPFGMDEDRDGNLFIGELSGDRLLKLDRAGRLTTVAGQLGQQGFAGDGGPAAQARFHWIHNLAIAPNNDIFIADTFNHHVRKIDARTGVISSVIGAEKKGFSGDGGPAAQASCGDIYCVALDMPRNRLILTDLDNRRIRVITLADGRIDTLAGNGEKGLPADGAPAKASPLFDPRAAASDVEGNVYILERGGNAVRVVDPNGRIRTVAGTGRKGLPGPNVPALKATFSGPKHLCIDPHGDVIIADTDNHVISKLLVRQKRVVRLVGTGQKGSAGLNGPPLSVQLNIPHGVFVDRAGTLYVCDSGNNRVLKIVP